MLPYLVDRYHFTIRLLDLLQLHQEVPEPGLRDHGVGCKYPHAVEFGCRVRFGGQMPPNDLILIESTYGEFVSTAPA